MAAQNINRAARDGAAGGASRSRTRRLTSSSSSACTASRPTSAAASASRASTRSRSSSTQGGTLITTLQAVRFPIEFGLARTIDTESPTGVNAQKPLIQAEIVRTDHPVFYGYENKIFPIKFGQGSQVFRVGIADQGNVLAQYVGGDASVLSGLMVGADNISRPRVRGGHAAGAQRQRPRDHVREQPDLSLAEPRRVQHGVQLDHQLERRAGPKIVGPRCIERQQRKAAYGPTDRIMNVHDPIRSSVSSVSPMVRR